MTEVGKQTVSCGTDYALNAYRDVVSLNRMISSSLNGMRDSRRGPAMLPRLDARIPRAYSHGQENFDVSKPWQRKPFIDVEADFSEVMPCLRRQPT